ncbi:Ankyrin-2 [Dactylellina cionopaga]|nr:Ankyrin-2 [Dactylellina cionopaga]
MSGGPDGTSTVLASSCWDKARTIFLNEVSNSNRFSKTAVADFLNDNYRIDKAINTCVAMKTKADQEYGSKQGRFATKLLNVLRTVKEVGDAYLEFAPESVSIAWSAVSLLIKVGTDDVDKCELISGCCEHIVTIVLNCRLYENRYSTVSKDGQENALQEIELKILGAIPNLLYLILDFSWHTQYHLDKKKLLRSFKECFSNTLKGKIDGIVTEYGNLRSMAGDAFQEKVMDQLSLVAARLDKSVADLKGELFPVIQDLTLKLETIDNTINTRFANEDIHKRFSERCQRFNPSEIHSHTFIKMFEPIRHDYEHMSLWLFADANYRAWEDTTEKSVSLLCLKGPRGFGKSVKMTCVAKRLMDIIYKDRHALVLFFYFKKGDDALQYTLKGLESLIFQLLDHIKTSDDADIMKQCIEIIEEVPISSSDEPSAGDAKHASVNGKTQIITPEYITTVFQQIAALTNLPIYIVVDAIDECEDRVPGNVMHCLKELSRSSESVIKVICSCRDNINIESLLQDKSSQTLVSSKVPGEEAYALPSDIKTIIIDEKANAEDLGMYLTKKVESMVLRRVGGKYGEKFNQELEKIVNIIQTKANGSFTYAGMVVANLQQPTKSTLENKLSQLPPAMEGLYRRSLEVLTSDEQSLVIFALKWVVWGVNPVTVLEIVEHYKEIYHPKTTDSIFSNEDSITKREANLEAKDGDKMMGQPIQKNANKKSLEDDDPYSDPEIADTKYHLQNAGRDFFQFDDATDSISVHLSVKEWIQSEAKQFAENMAKPNAPLFSKNENGQWTVLLPIPATVADGQGLTELINKREANLAIVIEILYALNNKNFQHRYMLLKPTENHVELIRNWGFWKNDLKQSELENILVSVEKLSSEAHTFKAESGHPTAETASTNLTLPTGLTEPSPSMETTTIAPEAETTAGHVDLTDAVASIAPSETDPLCIILNDTRTGGAAPLSPEANIFHMRDYYDRLSRNSDKGLEDVSISTGYYSTLEEDEDNSSMRYEVRNLEQHLCLLQEEWKPEERIGRQWGIFWEQLKLLMRPQTWRRWVDTKNNDKYGGNWEPLHMAANSGLVFILDYLVEQGIAGIKDLNARGYIGSPLHVAVRNHPEFVKALLGYGANINARFPNNTPLLDAMLYLSRKYPCSQTTTWESSKILISAGASLNHTLPFSETTMLQLAAGIRDTQLFQMIISRMVTADINKGDSEGNTPMHSTFSPGPFYFGQEPAYDESAKILHRDSGQQILEMLFEAGADVNAQNFNSESPLDHATCRKDIYGMKWLLEHGADINDDDSGGNTCLHKILNSERPFYNVDPVLLARTLIEGGLDVTRKSKDGKTVLSLAVKHHEAPLVRYLLDVHKEKFSPAHDYLFQQDLHSRSLLNRCAARGKGGAEIADMLVEGLSSEEISYCLKLPDTDKGLTPLHVAAEYGNIEMLDYLLSLKPDLTAKAFNGKTALDIAVYQFVLTSESLSRKGPQGLGLTVTSIERVEQCLCKLLAAAPDIDFEMVDYQMLLHTAVRCKAEKLINLVAVKRNAMKLDQPDQHGWTAHHVAVKSDAKDFLERYFPDYPHDTVYDTLPTSKRPRGLIVVVERHLYKASEDGLEVWQIGNRSAKQDIENLILSDHPIPAEVDRYYFEMTATSTLPRGSGAFSIGLWVAETKREDDWWYSGIGFSSSGYITEDTGTSRRSNRYWWFQSSYGPKTRTFGKGPNIDVVGCGLDTRRGYIFFTLNGEYLGVATTLPMNQRWFPGVTAGEGGHLSMNFGQRPFTFDRPFEALEILGM